MTTWAASGRGRYGKSERSGVERASGRASCAAAATARESSLPSSLEPRPSDHTHAHAWAHQPLHHPAWTQTSHTHHLTITPHTQDAGSDLDDYGSDINDGFDADYYGDAADREALAKMTELEREMVLADRAEARDREVERRRTARLAAGVRGTPASAKRGAVAAATADRTAARSKQPEAAARRAAAAELRDARRAAASRAAVRGTAGEGEVGEEGGGDYTTRPGRVVEEDGYETGEDARAATTAGGRRRHGDASEDEGGEDADAEPASHAEAVAAQVRRAQLAKWLGEPHAARTLPGTLIRLAYRGSYMVAEITEIVDRPPGTYRDGGAPVASPYPLLAGELPRGGGGAAPTPIIPGAAPPSKSITTNTWLRIARGASTRLFPALLVSNTALTEEEFESWGRQLGRDAKRPWPRSAARAAAAAISSGAAYTYTADDVKAMVEAKRAAGGGPRNRAVERTRLVTLHAAAVEAGEAGEAARLADDLAALDAKAAAEAAARAAAAASSLDTVNRRNAERNLTNSLKGVPGVAAGLGVGVEIGGGGVGGEGGDGGGGGGDVGVGVGGAADPFKRRETRPRHMWATGGRKAAADKEAAADAEDARPGAAGPASQADAAQAADAPADEADPATLYAPVLALDLSRLATGPAPAPTAADLARKLLGGGWAPPVRGGGGNGGEGRSFTLDEYFRRRQEMGS